MPHQTDLGPAFADHVVTGADIAQAVQRQTKRQFGNGIAAITGGVGNMDIPCFTRRLTNVVNADKGDRNVFQLRARLNHGIWQRMIGDHQHISIFRPGDHFFGFNRERVIGSEAVASLLQWSGKPL